MRRKSVAGIALLIAVGAGSVALVRARTHAGGGAAKNEASVEAAATLQAAPLALPSATQAGRRTPGDVAEYELAIDSDVAVVLGAMPGREGTLSPMAQLRTAGRLVERTLQNAGAGAVSLVTLEGATATLGAREHRGNVEATMARGIVIERDARGTIGRVRLPNAGDADAVEALRQLADVLQTTARQGDGKEWSASEATSEGTRAARYASAGEAAFVKHVDRITLTSAGPRPAALPDGSGELRGASDAVGLVELNGHEVHLRKTTEGALLGRATTTLSLHRVATSRDLGRAMTLSATLDESFGPWMAIDAQLPPRPIDPSTGLKVLVGDRTLADLEGKLARIDRDPLAAKDVDRTLWAYLRLHPDACESVAQRAAKLAPGKEAHLMASSLLRAGTPEAQHATVGLARAWMKEERGEALVAGMGGVPEPTAESEAFLRSLRGDPDATPDVARASEVALGNVANHVREADPARAESIAAEIDTRLGATADPSDQTSMLAALGNSRSERAADVTKFLDSDDPQVRRMAVFALGRAPGDTTHALLEKLAATDADEQVRRAATRALSAGGPG